MDFTKLHGTGNDFIAVDGRETDRDWGALARRICDRHFGVGADGLLVAAASSRADVRMRLLAPPPIKEYALEAAGRTISITPVSMGNPHAIHFQEAPVADYPLRDVGPDVEHHRLFPNRTNFEVVRMLGPGRAEMRVWERGVGETLSCGSGASAVMVAARMLGHTQSSLELRVPGGTLDLAWDGEGEVILSGPVAEVFRGTWPD
jgi:diaminopimelate epimerase